MTATQAADVLEFAVVISLWMLVLFKLLPDFRLDSFRQSLFCVRDELFDYAADGNIAFDDPAYKLLRLQMNALIRYAHQLTVFRMLVSYVLGLTVPRASSESWHAVWEPSLARVSNEKVRNDLRKFHDRAMSITIKHLISGSPLLWLGILAAAILLLGHGAATGTRQVLKAAARRVMVGPLDQKRIEDEAFAATA